MSAAETAEIDNIITKKQNSILTDFFIINHILIFLNIYKKTAKLFLKKIIYTQNTYLKHNI